MEITIVDAGISNIRSVENAFRHVGASVRTVTQAEDVAVADAVVLPGVGAFEAAMRALNAGGLVGVLRDKAASGAPMLGVCLGMQLYADASEEFGEHPGLGVVPGRVVQLSPSDPQTRVPNIGWHSVMPTDDTGLFGVRSGYFYHVHSYHFRCDDPADVAATIEYGGETVAVAIERGNLFGVQFHPEKSQDEGLDLIARFCDVAAGHNPGSGAGR